LGIEAEVKRGIDPRSHHLTGFAVKESRRDAKDRPIITRTTPGCGPVKRTVYVAQARLWSAVETESKLVHYWKTFCPGPNGVCVEFHRFKLLQALRRVSFRSGVVKYVTLATRKSETPRLADLPFAKRVGFKDEGEFRVIYKSVHAAIQKKDADIPLSCIHKVTLSPQMHPDLLALCFSIA
jgi:hypothetical protein